MIVNTDTNSSILLTRYRLFDTILGVFNINIDKEMRACLYVYGLKISGL
jgi:hypothetical protein